MQEKLQMEQELLEVGSLEEMIGDVVTRGALARVRASGEVGIVV